MASTKDFFREKKKWSFIKDDILDWYLTPYIEKILHTNKPLLLVDCFAGKGKFDDGNDGSPLIIAKKIKRIIDIGKHSKIRGVFIEKKYGKYLKDNLNLYDNCQVIEGTFEDNFERVLKPNANENLFIYVDPYGIKALDFNRFLKLKQKGLNSYELLMNFNTFGFLREGCRLLKYNYEVDCKDCTGDDDAAYETEIQDSNTGLKLLNSIADGSYWQKILTDYNEHKFDMFKAEELFMSEYLKRFKEKNLFKYTLSIPIKVNSRTMPKYRLVFGSNYHDGIFLMCDNMNKQWKRMLEEQRQGQLTFFEFDFPDMSIIKDFDMERCINRILNDSVTRLNLIDLLCKLIEELGISYSVSEYKNALKIMEKKEFIKIYRFPEITDTGKKAKSLDHKIYKIEVEINNEANYTLY